MSDVTENPIIKIEKRLGCDWSAVRAAKKQANKKAEKLDSLLKGISPGGASIIVFGSLARGEWTAKSDVDWTLLIDSPADPGHREAVHKITHKLEDAKYVKPGRTGVFGNMAFSHDIIHQIGGQRDTNHNTTQRILLLSESRCVADDQAFQQVIKCVLERYIEDDVSLAVSQQKVPRFLLNDVVRFWRTMAVDFAHKMYEREREGWGLRNIKLRFSRKLIFVAGLLACFSCELDPTGGMVGVNEEERKLALVHHLQDFVKKSPLEVLAEYLGLYAKEETARSVMESYNSFVGLLDDENKRTELQKLEPNERDSSATYKHADKISKKFNQGLISFFYDDNDELGKLIRKYGVF